MRGFIKQLFESASSLALINITITIAIYLAGYIIVNAFLSKNYILQTQVLHTSYISAGISFWFINLIAALAALPLAYLISWSITNAEGRIKTQPGDRVNRWLLAAGAGLLLFITLVLATIIAAFGIAKFTAFFLGLSSRGNASALSAIISPSLFQIFGRLIFVYALLAGVIVLQSRLANAGPILTLLSALTILFFAFTEYYVILVYAERVYSYLPVTIGGGQPQHVRIYMEKATAGKYKNIFTDYGFSFFSNENSSDEMLITNNMELFWQVGISNVSKESSPGYAVHPVDCKSCPVIFISPSDVTTVGYFP